MHFACKSQLDRNTTLLFLAVSFFFLSTNAHSLKTMENEVMGATIVDQQVEVTGTVTDDAGQPLPGVNIIEKGTVNGVVTDFDGNYSILVTDSNSVLVFSSLGFKTEERAVGQSSIINISMVEDAQSLDEVIVVGYGTQKKSDLTGAISSISGDNINETKESNAINALAGKVAGVDISFSNNSPGSSPNILVRGRSSLNFSNEPLIVVDGIPLEGSLNDINPGDIASIEVLKDASSSAIYGARGANGVVLITTKRGKPGKAQFSYDTYYGVARPAENYDVFNTSEWIDFKLETVRAQREQDDGVVPGTYPIPNITDPGILRAEELEAYNAGVDTDFQDLGYQNGRQISHQLGVSGGSDKTKYAVSLSYFDQEGVFKPTNYERYTLRTNLDFDLTDRLKLGVSQQLSFSERNALDITERLLLNTPLVTPYEADGVTATTDPTADGLVWNALGDLDKNNFQDVTKSYRYLGNIFASYQISDDFKYTLNLQPQYVLGTRNTFQGSLSPSRVGSTPIASKDATLNTAYTIENILTYSKSFNEDHTLNATLLYSIQDSKIDNTSITVSGLAAESQKWNSLGDAEVVEDRDSFLDTEAWESYMGRFNYGYKNKYLLTFTGRYDGSSKLSEGNKYKFFPSAAFAWKIMEEDFMSESNVFSNLKLRTGYGTVGRNPIAPFSTQGTVIRTEGSFGNTAGGGFRPEQIANPSLGWEITTTFDLGIDFGIAQNRISGSLDYYTSNTTDLLLERVIPISSGFESVLENVGETKNSGVEAVLSAKIIDSDDFKWAVDLNFSSNKSEIVKLFDSENDDIGNQWFIGKPLSVYYDRVFNGIWQSNELAEAQSYDREPGDIKLVDLDGNGIYDDDDRQIIGQFDPKWTGGITSRIDYKGFDFTVVLYTRQGHMTTASAFNALNTMFGRYNNLDVNYWTPENPSNEYPRPNAGLQRPIDAQVLEYIDASFVRVRNLTLGYNLSEDIVNNLGLSILRLYVSAQNPILWTKTDIPGLDPEVAEGLSTGSLGNNKLHS